MKDAQPHIERMSGFSPTQGYAAFFERISNRKFILPTRFQRVSLASARNLFEGGRVRPNTELFNNRHNARVGLVVP